MNIKDRGAEQKENSPALCLLLPHSRGDEAFYGHAAEGMGTILSVTGGAKSSAISIASKLRSCSYA